MARWQSGRTDPETGARLATARVNKGLTQLDAAKGVGVSVFTITNWEHARTEPTASQLKTLCCLYGITPNQILGVV